LSYLWYVDGSAVPVASGMTAATRLDVGDHDMLLLVDNGQTIATTTVKVSVIRGSEAVANLVSKVDSSELSRKSKRPLIESLEVACDSFDASSCSTAVSQLNTFQNKARAQVAPSNPGTAQELISHAQSIIDHANYEETLQALDQ
jgi:hypothetical protein